MQDMNVEQIQNIIKEVYEEEKRTHNLNPDIIPVTVIQFYKDYVKDLTKDKQSLKSKMKIAKLPLHASGVYLGDTETKEGSIFIFLQKHNKLKEVGSNLYKTLFVCYHEIRHASQINYDKYSYDGFIYDMDYFLQKQSTADYHAEHSKYSYEIGANLYGAIKAKEYIQKNYPDLYEQEKEYIEKFEQKQKFYYMTYDASDTIDRMLDAAKTQLKNNNSEEVQNMDKISPVLGMFLNSDMSCKNINEIITQEKFKTLDKRIVYAFLSSKTFLENINIEELSDEGLSLLSESLQYTNLLYQNQFKWLEQEKSINLTELLKAEKSILQKYALIGDYYTRKIKHKLNFRRSDKKREEHMESVPEYLEKTNKLIRKRTIDGYITINIFYILGSIISLSTILYLLIKK